MVELDTQSFPYLTTRKSTGTRNELGDNRSLHPELFRKIKFRLNGMPIGENLLIAGRGDLIKNFFVPSYWKWTIKIK